MDRRRGPRWRWANVPVPKSHVAGLLLGLGLEAVRPWHVVGNRTLARTAGFVGVCVGLSGIWLATRAVGEGTVDRPTALVTTGPYAVSRNPMYVAWTALYVGVALLADSRWPFVWLPAVLAVTHRTVRREERALERRFGADYRDYRRSVGRYL